MDKEFAESYNTAEWQKKRNRILERDNYTCQICGNTTGVMQVHHLTYKNCHGKAYGAPAKDLVTLCCNCHNHDDGDHIHFFSGKFCWDSSSGCFRDSEHKIIRNNVVKLENSLYSVYHQFHYYRDAVFAGTWAEQEWIPEMGRTVWDWVDERVSTLERMREEAVKIIEHIEDKYQLEKWPTK